MAENHFSNNNVIILPGRRRLRLQVAAFRWRSQSAARRSELPPASTISDYELHAFVDNALDDARRARVQAFLRRHPAAAADAAAYSRQNRMLRALKRPPTPTSLVLDYLAAQLAARLMRAHIRRAAVWSAVVAMIGVVTCSLVSGSWIVVSHLIVAAGR